jgi:hypothetical protein
MLQLFLKKAVTVNPTKYEWGFKHEDPKSLVQLFHKINHHVLEKFYNFSIRDDSAENVAAMAALLDFEMNPKTEKKEFIMNNFIDKKAPFEVNLSGAVRVKVNQKIALENMTKANLRRGRSGAFIRRDNRPFVLSQVPTTFEDTGLIYSLCENMSDTWTRYSDHTVLSASGDVGARIASLQRLAFNMVQTGFSIPRCMLTI